VNSVEEALKNWKDAPASGETTTQLEFNQSYVGQVSDVVAEYGGTKG
jgi:hypothetical protein